MAAVAVAAQGLDRWVASLVALTRLPEVGSEVFYIAEGHAEQWPSLPAPPAAGPPMVPCTVESIKFFTAGEQPYCRISLIPGNHSAEPAADPRPDPDVFLYFHKVLVASDIRQPHLVAPRLCGETMFPLLKPGIKTQFIRMSDLDGEPYEFVHTVGKNDKHTLKGAAWAQFVRVKEAAKGDTVVFFRGRDFDPAADLVIESRRRQPFIYHGQPEPAQELELAGLGAASFTVTYHPELGSGSPFVVPRGSVDEASAMELDVGMRVRIRQSDLVLHAAGKLHGPTPKVITGIVREVNPGPWRNIKVDLDASGSSSSSMNVNRWEVEAIEEPGAKVSTDLRLSNLQT